MSENRPPQRPTRAAPRPKGRGNYCGWGRTPRIEAEALGFDTPEGARACLEAFESCAVRGLGRSYGDSALAPRLILTSDSRAFLDFDPEAGLVRCEAGVSLGDLVDTFLPRGWFPGVTPGTRHVSVGGAVAGDVHGKNHHKAGCFSEFVEELDLLMPGGRVATCSRTQNPELFRATCGGMGLTGVILSALVRLVPVASGLVRERILPARSLEETFALFEEQAGATYSVAWMDALARGGGLGRSLLILGEHAERGALEVRRAWEPRVPCDGPGFLLNRWTIGLMNRRHYRRNSRRTAEHLVPVPAFFYPLDALRDWNRLYGRAGFLQYQFVLPKAASLSGMRLILDRVAAAGLAPLLAVLKLFGPANDNLLSFPLEGYTLALDFRAAAGVYPVLDELDRMVLDHGGRLYLCKDARMGRSAVERGYPGLERFRALRRELGLAARLNSLQSQRLGL